MGQLIGDSDHSSNGSGVAGQTAEPLSQIDDLVGQWSAKRLDFYNKETTLDDERRRFEEAAVELAYRVVVPAFGAITDRLQHDGGDGWVDVRPGDGHHSLRITLWMSLEGKIVRPGRTDRNPYLQLDIDAARRCFDIWEGDMWAKQGSSRASSPLTLEELTTEAVTARALNILSRAATHGVTE